MKNIALFPGTFSKFHIGHLNILKKSQRIFDNVVICIGVNQDKTVVKPDLTEKNKYAEYLRNKTGCDVNVYTCFMHELVEQYERAGYNVVVIRGIRNSKDLEYEVNQMKYVNNFKKIDTVYITCDVEYEHISSSSIRKIEELGGVEMTKPLLV